MTDKKNMLIVEDDFENQEFLRIFLKRWFEITICDSGASFYESLQLKSWDIIIMDISIYGDKNGLQLTSEIKNDPQYANIPVICYTAHAFSHDRTNALNAGSDAYISKPVSNDDLLDTIFSLINGKNKT